MLFRSRAMVMKGLDYFGVEFDFELNENIPGGMVVLSKPESKVKVVVMPTNEELVIARDAVRLSGLNK